MTLPALDDEEYATRMLRASLGALDNMRDGDAKQRLYEVLASHIRSAMPMVLAGPAAPISPVVEVSRDLADGGRYALSIVESCVVLSMTHPDLAFTPIEAFRFCADFEAVASSVKATP